MGIIEEVIDDVLVEIINIERATIREAEYLKEKITPKINSGYIKVIVDLSAVEFLDSTFLGVIVGTLKKVVKQGGDLKL
ncbi:MAG: STAS domain-containing protein, partial [Ignavibacteria bacterium]|nr:STAS domain-containing protein [Ignavibacteria bacterium]